MFIFGIFWEKFTLIIVKDFCHIPPIVFWLVLKSKILLLHFIYFIVLILTNHCNQIFLLWCFLFILVFLVFNLCDFCILILSENKIISPILNDNKEKYLLKMTKIISQKPERFHKNSTILRRREKLNIKQETNRKRYMFVENLE